MAEKTNANIGFEKQLWDAACVLWGHIPAAEYRKVIIGLIFLRYISAAFDKRYQELVEEGEGFEDDRDAYEMDNVFFVPSEARWSNIASKAHTPEIGTIIDNAMRAIEAENKKLKNVLPKNYASPDLDKRILGDVVDIFTNNIDMSDTEASEDLLGRTYEYCIAQFAEKEGVGGGEFYTPSSVVKRWCLFCDHLTTAECMIAVVVLVACLSRVKNLLKHIVINEVPFLFMVRKQIQIPGKWQK